MAYTHKNFLIKCINKEIQLSRVLGPFPKPLFEPFLCSPVGMVLKKDTDQMQMITHLSHPRGTLINSLIDPAETSTTYQDFQQAVQLVALQGQGAWMAKEDKSAFHNIPMHFQDLHLLGIKIDTQFYIDCCLPFGASISCTIFHHVFIGLPREVQDKNTYII